ncbi:TetR/AcrR family transcriptional regulator [Olleya sp. Bg11-27]|uniref:TetR/AcrR family transcriptional regulator n=1 Tax=Olleya sp. Bg11-27 TaxID=2058135 RepID=UPI000C3104B2|nr:TetR/AcrR family transcriptional regulator [Olleya sp. Bg11-27]AUC74930.1 TetR/AcrR family transcriptional regulator [Olleya sp. Bg11-27]
MPRVKLFDENEVLTKAMHLFWKQGYAATSVQDLVNCLGINRASIYDTFGGKAQLFKKAFELYRNINLEGVIRFFENQPDVKIGFSELFQKAIQDDVLDKDNKGCFVVNTTTELVPNDKSLLVILEKNKQDFEKVFYKYLKKGQESGQLKTTHDLKAIATLFYTLYNGIRVVSKTRPSKKESSDSITIALSLLD